MLDVPCLAIIAVLSSLMTLPPKNVSLAEWLVEGGQSIAAAAQTLGVVQQTLFSDMGHFSRAFRRVFDQTPSGMRSGR